MKKQNLDFFIEMKYYTIQNYLKEMQGCWNLGFWLQILLSIGINQDHEITQDMHCVILLCHLKRAVLLLVSMRYLYEYWDSNSLCKFIDTSIWKITEVHSVAASQPKNDYMQLYLFIRKVKKDFLYEMVNCGQINKGQVDIFAKCLKLVLIYRTFYKNKPQAARNKGFRTYVDSKALTLKS